MTQNKPMQFHIKRVIAIFLLAVFMSTGLISVYVYSRVQKDEMTKIKESHGQLMPLIETHYQSKIMELIEKSEFISRDPRLAKLQNRAELMYHLRGVPENVEIEKRAFLSEIRKHDDTVNVLFVMTSEGLMYLVEPYNTQINLDRYDFSDRSYYKAVVEERGTIISETFIGADGFKTFVVASPVVDKNNKIESIVAQVYHLSNMEHLFDENLLENVGTGLILDSKGEVVTLINDDLNLRTEGTLDYAKELYSTYGGHKDFILDRENILETDYYVSKLTFRNGWSFYLLKDNKSIDALIKRAFLEQVEFIFLVILIVSLIATHRIYKTMQVASENEKFILTHELERTKEMEIELREKHSLYHQLFQRNASVMLLICRDTLEILEANEAAETYYGISIDDLKKMQITDLSQKSESDLKIEFDQTAILDESHFTSVHKLADGSIRDVEIYSGPVYYQNEIVICSVIHDVTTMRQLGEEMQQSIDYYLTILDAFPTLIWRVDENGEYNHFNQTWLSYTGRLLEEEINDGWLDHIHPSDFENYNIAFSEAFSKRMPFITEMRLKNEFDEYRWMLNRGRPYSDIKGRFSGYIGTCVDIHEMKELEIKLIKTAQKAEEYSKLKDKFLANMSHEVRTPISGIVGITELMLKIETDDKKFDQLNLIRNSAYNLLDLVNDILDLSKIESGNFELNMKNFSLNDLVLNVIKLFDARIYEKKIDLRFDLDPQIPHQLFGDPMRLKQILVNLVGNAIKFTEEGFVEISAKLIEKHKEKVNIELIVKDSGIGISENNRDRVFEEFVQDDQMTVARFGGTGLGLSIVRSLVELMGGTIIVNSQIGVGTEIHCNVFMKDYGLDGAVVEVDDELEEITKAVEKTENPLNILIAEDNKINQLFISSLCRDVFGDHVDIVDDGISALNYVKEKMYDCILMDKNMPGLNGLEVTKEIKKINDKRNIPVILITAAKLVDEREMILTSGIDYYLSKPVNQKHLKEILDQIRERKVTHSIDENKVKARAVETPENDDFEFINMNELIDVYKLLGKDTLLAMIDEFLVGYEDKIQAIELDVNELNYDGLLDKVHNLKGSIGYFKTDYLLNELDRFNNAIELHSDELIISSFNELKEHMNILTSELTRIQSEIKFHW